MKVAVCDDNKVMLDFLSRQISENLTLYNIIHEISSFISGKTFLSQHEKSPFDVVLLDIKLPDIDGFETAKRVKRVSEKTHIIFITTESCLVYDSFDYHPFYFIPKTKPDILKAKLKSVIRKLVDEISNDFTICFDLPYGEKKHINTNEIVYVESTSNYVDIICRTETIHIRRKLCDIIDELPYKSFARIHNRCVVNMHYVARIDNSRLKAILKNDRELDISRKYKKDFSERYNIFLRNFS